MHGRRPALARFLLPQEDEACALRCLDVSGNDGLSDGILKVIWLPPSEHVLRGSITIGRALPSSVLDIKK